ncbi:MAG: trehalase family glycosidase [Gemmatimonas sp.]
MPPWQYDTTGKLTEKSHVWDLSSSAVGGEYPTQDGFGWTNGVALMLSRRTRVPSRESGPSVQHQFLAPRTKPMNVTASPCPQGDANPFSESRSCDTHYAGR